LNGPQPQSILPHVEIVDGRDVRFMLTGEIAVRFADEGSLDWGERPPGGAWSGANFRLSMWPRQRFIGYQTKDKQETYHPLNAIIAPYSCAYPPDTERTNQFRVELRYDPASPGARAPYFCQFRPLPPQPSQAGPKLTGRLGGLEFSTREGEYLSDD